MALKPKKWMLPELPNTLVFTATASYVDDQGHIFLQPKSSEFLVPCLTWVILLWCIEGIWCLGTEVLCAWCLVLPGLLHCALRVYGTWGEE